MRSLTAVVATARRLALGQRRSLLCSDRRSFHITTKCRDDALQTPVEALKGRGLLNAVSNPTLSSYLKQTRATVYTGFDPTATSLHVGNLLMIVALLHFQAQGHQPIALIGGATGCIGDPSGKSVERNALDAKTLNANIKGIDAQLRAVFKNAHRYMTKRRANTVPESDIPPIAILNNLEWLKDMTLLDFLGDAGRLARVSIMLSRESVQRRLDSSEGISFTEFSYQLLQGYDFYHLQKTRDCRIQIGGSDQWGNIMAGMELIRKKAGVAAPAGANAAEEGQEAEPHAYGLTLPLVTNAKGEKFGKSEGNAIWLDPELVSPYEFYQFFRRTPDSEVEKYLNYFTLLPRDKIADAMTRHAEKPGRHVPQRLLAAEVTEMVHGEVACQKASTMSSVMFDESLTDTSSANIIDAFEGDSRMVSVPRDKVVGADIVSVALLAGAVQSRSAGRKLHSSGGLYLNQRQVDPKTPLANAVVSEKDLIEGVVCVIRTGKSNMRVVRVKDA
ncbi:putative tyrosine-tRNA ligase [Fimicolochytrium jonesii]|uniref:putative tyrosine-tRNA ligase n=1 Tax=Fimicolochytrium jonesii TaxID=1396493 RepID=UPI0022FED693|nr:putative tyrosine-tRNA ligase [Fimicolochytrium jonesii]KAI8820587.1 putative tyrosine-tRNA ligase [Fimicolochytrium jonesii]